MERNCFLFGDRNTPEAAVDAIENAVEHLCSVFDVKTFIIGQYGNFRQSAESAVQRVKERHPDIQIEYLPQPHDSRMKLTQERIQTILCAICYVEHIGKPKRVLRRLNKNGVIILNLANSRNYDFFANRKDLCTK